MKTRALEHFRGTERHNCAQAVYRSLEKHRAIDPDTLHELAAAGSGRAPNGLCGALYAAKKLLPPEHKTELRAWFEQNAGSVQCRDIRRARRLSCRDCVAAAADFIERALSAEIEQEISA